MNHVVRDVFLFHFFLSILLITQGESLWDFHKLGCFECSKRALKLKVNKTTRKLYYLTHPFRGRQFQGRSAAQRSHQRPTFFPSFLSSSSSWLDRSALLNSWLKSNSDFQLVKCLRLYLFPLILTPNLYLLYDPILCPGPSSRTGAPRPSPEGERTPQGTGKLWGPS